MILANDIIEILKENMTLRNRIAIELNCSEQTIRRWINDNDPDGDLTKVSVLKVISEVTGIPVNDLLLEVVKK